MNNLKEIRLSKGLNQYKLANESKVFQSRISLIENGYVTATLSEKERLAMALDCLVEELFGPNPLARLIAAGRRGRSN
jgi:transcriptional regulator with XRE-family HTH domain